MVTDERREMMKMRVAKDFSGIYLYLVKETESPVLRRFSFILLTSRLGYLLLVSRYTCRYLTFRTISSLPL